eukprot:3768766-Rhodomonas_salina.7
MALPGPLGGRRRWRGAGTRGSGPGTVLPMRRPVGQFCTEADVCYCYQVYIQARGLQPFFTAK